MIKDHNGKVYKSKRELAKAYGMDEKTLRNRLKKMTLEEALIKPVRTYNRTGRYKGIWEQYYKPYKGESKMSQAYKCDRCGKLYESEMRTLASKNYSVLKPHTISYNVGNPGTYLNYVADLCPKCQSELELWMKGTAFEIPDEEDRLCSNCKYHDYNIITEPCFSCNYDHSNNWAPKEDQNG
jgi:ribosomal protein L37E